jgi:hypothetical protein
MANSADFYTQLPAVTDFLLIGNAELYAPVPDDWWIAMSDVVDSTLAIERGQYKDVNTVGGLSAIAVSNAIGDLEFPFVFGGDGVTMLLHSSQLDAAREALASVRELAQNLFGLRLRVGFAPMRLLRERKEEVKILKFRRSGTLHQAMFLGAGVEAAERLLKDENAAAEFLVPLDYKPMKQADLSGFVCNWLDIPSPKEETVSFIVKTLDPEHKDTESYLREILEEISRICGSDDERNPLSAERLQSTAELRAARLNALIAKHGAKNFSYWLTSLQFAVQNFLLTRLPKPKSLAVRQSIMANADIQKFDGSLKMVMACTSENRERLTAYFESLRRKGAIAYGIHVADRAHITCYMQSQNTHIHFIDAADGGYALAAKQLKNQLKNPLKNQFAQD